MAKSYLIVCDRTPYGSMNFPESLDMAMSAAAFDLPVKVLLQGDGIYAALACQEPATLERKNAGKLLNALEVYGVSGIYVAAASLAARNLSSAEMLSTVEVLDQEAVGRLFSDAQLVIQI